MQLRACRTLIADLVLVASVVGQAPTVVNQVSPDAALAGATIVLRGNNFAALTAVAFTADTGGFVGPFTQTVPVTVVSATTALVVVPTFGFSPPGAAAQSSPWGSLQARAGNTAVSASIPFFYMQQTFGVVTTDGAGTTSPTPGQRAVVSFLQAQGTPTAGNAGFALRLELAEPGAAAFLAIGTPGSQPYLPVGDGALVVDLSSGPIILGPFPIDPAGELSIPLPIPGPGPFGVWLAVQWGISTPGFLGVSNALLVSL